MNELNRKVALAAFTLAAIGLGSTTAGAAVQLYGRDLMPPVVTKSRLDERSASPSQIEERSTRAWSPQECVPGGYWWIYRPNNGSIPMACGVAGTSR